ncbi:MAG: YtxH domain-containing protein [Ectobacillus sp.]
MSKTKAFVTGLLCGGAVAGIAALLAAPSSGKDLRKKMKEKTNDWKQSLAELKNDTQLLKEQVVQTSAEGKDVFIELKQDMQTAFSSWSKETKSHRENIEQELKEIQQSIENLQKSVPAKE